MRPFFGYHMPNYTFDGVPDVRLFEAVVERAQAAEAAGFDLLTVMDHFYQIGVVGQEDEPMLEAYSTLAAIAMRTERVMLSTMVSGVTYRNPALLAKTVTTLDVISKGRAVLGIGAAWNESEHAGYGFEYPPIARREDRLEEALAICKAMFTEERPSFEGAYYRIDRALNQPRPIQPGGPKILVGGGGEQRTLKVAARYADITNWFGSFEEATHKLGVLDRHCESIGRDPAEILRTVALSIVLAESESDKARILAQIPEAVRGMAMPATLDEAAELAHRYLDAGFGGIMFRNTMMRTPEAVARAGELIASLRKEGALA
ncbi:MAG TPA: LLM class F420-dependent oxidoreductase [Candidatus Limnocylindrales bacterium]|jgi:probable F420-dependent oxidoreductase, Rv1855c family|nr:LLM class F420-dependent oxidoreductase [Candidatus Limnocylindrales bacterium]